MARDTVLVTGIHRDELGFGDHVAALVDPAQVAVMRIPHGIARARKGSPDEFYSRAQHNEIYLQLFQQVKDRYRLLIDLHRGLDEAGRGADVFCHDEDFLRCLGARIGVLADAGGVHLIRIVSPDARGTRAGATTVAQAEARTWIPPRIWLGRAPLYVGLEVYLAEDGDGSEADWEFAHRAITGIQACATGASPH